MSEQLPKTESELIERLQAIDVRAPQELHRKIEAMVAEHSPARRRPLGLARWQLSGALALAGAVVAVLVISLAGSGSGGSSSSSRLSMRQALALTLRPATAAAPAENPHHAGQLSAAVGDVAFPYWDELGWHSTGARSDRVDGRVVTTVFYTNARGQRVGYAIVAGTPAPAMGGGVVSWRGGTPYRVLVHGAVHLVSWQRDGQLCVVAGNNVDSATLLSLAGSQGSGEVSS
jgi:hypothetical protein